MIKPVIMQILATPEQGAGEEKHKSYGDESFEINFRSQGVFVKNVFDE